MNVSEIMSRNLVVATPDMPLATAAGLLIEHRITGLPVVDDQRRILGVLTEVDLMRTVAEPHRGFRTVGELMTPRPVTIAADAPVHEVFDCLMTHPFRRVLIEEGGKLVGLVSRTDLLPYILGNLTAS